MASNDATPRDPSRLGRDFILALESDPRIQEIINQHSSISGAMGLIPVPAAGLAASLGNVYTMYYRINKAVGVSFSQNVVKSVAGMIASSLGQRVLISAGLEALKVIPVLGTCVGGLGEAVVLGAATAVQGKLYCEWLRHMCEKDAVHTDGTVDESVSESVIDTIFSSKSRIEDMVQDAKENAKHVDYKKYTAQAQEIVSHYKTSVTDTISDTKSRIGAMMQSAVNTVKSKI